MVLLEDISALYTIDFCLHLPSSGQAVFILQLHFGSAVGGLSVFGKAERSFLLWRKMTADIFGIVVVVLLLQVVVFLTVINSSNFRLSSTVPAS